MSVRTHSDFIKLNAWSVALSFQRGCSGHPSGIRLGDVREVVSTYPRDMHRKYDKISQRWLLVAFMTRTTVSWVKVLCLLFVPTALISRVYFNISYVVSRSIFQSGDWWFNPRPSRYVLEQDTWPWIAPCSCVYGVRMLHDRKSLWIKGKLGNGFSTDKEAWTQTTDTGEQSCPLLWDFIINPLWPDPPQIEHQ